MNLDQSLGIHHFPMYSATCFISPPGKWWKCCSDLNSVILCTAWRAGHERTLQAWKRWLISSLEYSTLGRAAVICIKILTYHRRSSARPFSIFLFSALVFGWSHFRLVKVFDEPVFFICIVFSFRVSMILKGREHFLLCFANPLASNNNLHTGVDTINPALGTN